MDAVSLSLAQADTRKKAVPIAETHTPSGVATSNVERNLFEFQLPADVVAGDAFEVLAWGSITQNSGVDKSALPRFRVAGATLAPTTNITIPSSTFTRRWVARARIVVSDTMQCITFGEMTISDAVASVALQPPVASLSLVGSATSSANTAASALVAFTWQPNSAVSFSTICSAASIRPVRRPSTTWCFSSATKTLDGGAKTLTLQCASREWNCRRTGVVERFELRSGDFIDADGSSKERAEFGGGAAPYNPSGQDLWSAYSFMLEPGAAITAPYLVVGQWHNTPDAGDLAGSPNPWEMRFIGADLQLVTRSDPAATTVSPPADVIRWTYTNFPRGTWFNFVHHVKFDPTGAAGVVETWVNGTQVVSSSPTALGFNDTQGPYWKYGLYRGASPETTAGRYANMEAGLTNLSARIANPLPII